MKERAHCAGSADSSISARSGVERVPARSEEDASSSGIATRGSATELVKGWLTGLDLGLGVQKATASSSAFLFSSCSFKSPKAKLTKSGKDSFEESDELLLSTADYYLHQLVNEVLIRIN